MTLLREADDAIFSNEFEPEILLLLDAKQKEDYSKLSTLALRKSFVEHFWKAQNPNPLLPENDRVLNYLNRRAFARKNFPLATPPYFDARGKYYIKFGNPQFRYQDAGGSRAIRSQVSIPFNYYATKPNETWSFVNVSRDYVVHFAQEDGGTFIEIESLKDVVIGSHRRGRLIWYWSDLLKNRFWMSSLITETVTEFIDIENSLLQKSSGVGGRVVKDSDRDARVIETGLYSNLLELEKESRTARLDVPAFTYQPVHAKNKLPFSATIAQFRASDDQTRLEVFVLSPLKKYVDRSDPASGDLVDIEFSALLRNDHFDTIATARFHRNFRVVAADLEDEMNAVGIVTILAPPAHVEVHIQVKDNRRDKIGFSEKSIAIHDFRSSNLMVSDLQFFINVPDRNQQQMIPVTEKQNVLLTPYPFEKIKKSLPLYCYFEIYNLQTLGADNEYEITYKVTSTDAKKPAISIIQTQHVSANQTRELISLDLSNLVEDEYLLKVSITARKKDKTIRASALKAFVLTE